MWVNPVYNRTLWDIQTRNRKAYINTADLNRIENNMLYLSQLFHCDIEGKVWQDGEFVFLSQLQRIERNLKILMAAYSVITTKSIPALPWTMYTQWNDIEKIIYDLYSRFYANKRAVSFCGEIHAGSRIGVI